MSLRSITLMVCFASILGCKATELHDGAGGASDLGAASGQGGAAGTGAGMGGTPAAGAGGDGGDGGAHVVSMPVAGGGAGGGNAGGASGDPASDPSDAGDGEPTLAERAADDQATVLSCGAPSPCAATAAGLTEGLHGTPSASEFECVLSALAQRTPGLYRHQTSHSFTNGSWQAGHILLIQEDGSALYTRTASGSVGFPPDFESMPIEGSATAQRCALKPVAFFEACLDAMTNAAAAEADIDTLSMAWSCASDGGRSAPGQLPWIEACEDASPLTCP